MPLKKTKKKNSNSIELSQKELDILIAVLQLVDESAGIDFSAFYEANPDSVKPAHNLLAKLEKLDKG